MTLALLDLILATAFVLALAGVTVLAGVYARIRREERDDD